MTKKEKPKKEKSGERPEKELNNLDIRVNAFGQIERDYDIDALNQFLNEKVKDKKLSGEEP